jgi:hypothetical protein
MSTPNDLIASLRSEGALDTRGHFKLDAQKAREKLRKFQLEDPHHYVLEFVAAATLLGATRVELTLDADELEMSFDGAALTAAQLEDLYSAAFVRSEDDTERAMRLLAIGATAAGALDFTVLTIESGEARLDILDSGASLSVTPLDAPRERTRIYMRERRRFGHLIDFLSNLRGDLAEKTALRERCRYSHVEVVLDGETISHGHSLEAGTLGAITFDTEHERGVLGFARDGGPTEVHMLQHGVLVSSYHTDAALVSVRAVVDSDRLTKNLSQSAFVADEAWKDVFHNVLRVTMHASLLHFLSQTHGLEAGGEDVAIEDDADLSWVRGVALHVFAEVARWREAGVEVAPQTAALAAALERAVVWEVSDRVVVGGEPRRHLSLAQVLARGNPDTLSFAHTVRRDLEVTPDFSPVLYSKQTDELASTLLGYTGRMRRSAVYELEVAQARHTNVARWRQTPHDGGLDVGLFSIQRARELGVGKVTVGFRGARGQQMQVVFVHEGHVLRRGRSALSAFEGMKGVVSGSLPVDRRFEKLSMPGAMARELAQVATGLVLEVCEAALEASADEAAASAFARDVLQAFATNQALEHTLRAFGVPDLSLSGNAWDQYVRTLRPMWRLHLLLDRYPSLEARARDFRGLGPFASAEVVPLYGGGYTSIEALVSEALQHRSVWIATPEEVTVELERDWADAQPARSLIVDPGWVEVARAFFSPFIYRAASTIHAAARKGRFMARPEEEVALEEGDELGGDTLDDPGQGYRGAVALRRIEAPGRARVQLFVASRPLRWASIELPVGRFDAALEVPEGHVDEDWSGLGEGPMKDALAHVERVAYEVLAGRLEALRGREDWDDDERREFLSAMVALTSAEVVDAVSVVARGHVWHAPVFSVRGGARVSLAALRDDAEAHGWRLLIVSQGTPTEQRYVPGDMLDSPVVEVHSELEREALAAWYGALEVVDVGRSDAREAQLAQMHREFMRRPETSLERGDAVLSVDVRSGRMSGRLHVLPAREGRLDVCIRHEGRELAQRVVPTEYGSFVAVVDVEGLRPSLDYSEVASYEDLSAELDALREVAHDALLRAIAKARFGDELCARFGVTALDHLRLARERDATRFERRMLTLPTLTLYGDEVVSVEELFARRADVGTILTRRGMRRNSAPVPDEDVLCVRDDAHAAAAAALFAEFELTDYTDAPVRSALFASLRNASKLFDGGDSGEAARVIADAAAAPVGEAATSGAPTPAPSTREQRALDRAREALLAARGNRLPLLGDEDVAHLEIAPLGGPIAFAVRGSRTVRVDMDHPVARQAVDHPDDPIALHMLASSIYSEINARERRITDAHELELLSALASLHLG